ncbi:MAG: hypothetical protein ISS72_02165 [Candidatus Brocadiae bacterium]|nr:hypothetical protein [Candidatus Brocadiia bacterium]
MQPDPVVDEVRRVREEYAKRFDYDLRAMAADLRKREQEHPERLVSYPPKPAPPFASRRGAGNHR